jgi:NAD(P)H-hydrate epimerase
MENNQIVDKNKMRQLDQLTIEKRGITSYDLMVHVGKKIASYVIDEKIVTARDDILVIAGMGNNGGDALVMAKHFYDNGLNPVIISVGNKKTQSSQNSKIFDRILKTEIEVVSIEVKSDLEQNAKYFEEATIIVDGLFGIGISRDVEGLYKDTITLMNQSYASVISIDIPSGIDADSGKVLGAAVHAKHTIIIQNYKQGNLLNDALDYSDKNHLIDVGIMQEYFEEYQVMLSPKLLFNKVKKRKHHTHKYHYGYVLTIGGSKGMMGAPVLAGYASLRTGSGLVKILYNNQDIAYMNVPYPELMVDTYENFESIQTHLEKKSAIVFGMGLGKNNVENKALLKRILETDIPLVIDADGIFYLKELLPEFSKRGNIIITPHVGELAMFLGVTTDEVTKTPLLFAKNIAHNYNITVVLKGAVTVITNDEETYLSTLGNPGLATAGSGDVLSGIIGSYLGQGYNELEAAQMGVILHSLAGDLAVKELGEQSLIASDITKFIPKILNQ